MPSSPVACAWVRSPGILTSIPSSSSPRGRGRLTSARRADQRSRAVTGINACIVKLIPSMRYLGHNADATLIGYTFLQEKRGEPPMRGGQAVLGTVMVLAGELRFLL